MGPKNKNKKSAVDDDDDFEAALKEMGAALPDNGTCPRPGSTQEEFGALSSSCCRRLPCPLRPVAHDLAPLVAALLVLRRGCLPFFFSRLAGVFCLRGPCQSGSRRAAQAERAGGGGLIYVPAALASPSFKQPTATLPT